MGHFGVDDLLYRHDKIVGLTPDAGWLWTLVGSCISGSGPNHVSTDGVISARAVRDMAHYANVSDPASAVALLVASGMWHDHRTVRRCDRCKHVLSVKRAKLDEGSYYMHDYLDWNIASEDAFTPDAKWKAKRNRALLRDTELCTQLKERDRWCCRYCHVRVDFGDRRTRAGGTYDHVDPATRVNSLESVVVACRGCNSDKGDRTPGEAEMELLDLADHLVVIAQRSGVDQIGIRPPVRSGSDRDPIGAGGGLIAPSRAHATPDGSGQGRAGARPGSDRDLTGDQIRGALDG